LARHFTARLFDPAHEESAHPPELRHAGDRLRRRLLDLRSGARPAPRPRETNRMAAPALREARPPPPAPARPGRLAPVAVKPSEGGADVAALAADLAASRSRFADSKSFHAAGVSFAGFFIGDTRLGCDPSSGRAGR
jgi:hypothetical protein